MMRRGNIEAERVRWDMNQEMLYRELGVSRQTYCTYINGGNIPSDKLEQLARMFGVTMEYLLQPTESWPRESA